MIFDRYHCISLVVVVLSLLLPVAAQRELGVRPSETGGHLMFEQAVYDVQTYDVSIKADPNERSIKGTTVMTAKVVIPTNIIVLHLDDTFTIDSVYGDVGGRQGPLRYEHRDGKIWVHFLVTKQPGENLETIITYSGKPRIAPRPPWVGGFMWEKTPSGADWISVALQNDGADLYFPVKDHPSDKANRAALRVTVPDPLVVAGPGRLEEVRKNADGSSTYNWVMTNPIPNYSIVFNAAPYRVIKDSMKSAAGDSIPIEFYILPESYEKGAKLIAETKKYVQFYEKYNGPFPFRGIKLGIAETPHLGMEHSTMLAYGNKFQYNSDGFDWLQLHELGHEWWANLVTASDWRDFWIHEGIQSFMDTLYLEHLGKKDAYFAAMKQRASRTRNIQPVAPREPKFAYQVYLAAPDYVQSDGDIYGKGAVIMHTLRYLIGDDAFFRTLRRMAYPTREMEQLTDGRQTRLVNTDDLLTIAEHESGIELDWFFEVYLRQPKLPKLEQLLTSSFKDGKTESWMELRWEAPMDLPFPMPIEIQINGKTERVEMKKGRAVVGYSGEVPVIDPKGWILRAQ
ncbi:M1 family metallopeptidase [Leptolyngbya sp. 7M]|uniref:M1 family metallopeptidase n=1 Tax=Leptolyngbya sp. 7M TaxID=2812896 RepID=UPI001B8C188E|nr:M1 family metallopeptidase [Leptolyngbya sp. 7M]QYO68189.1 M1 family metallopeptidase [Leptolyngbya sp. 7M]